MKQYFISIEPNQDEPNDGRIFVYDTENKENIKEDDFIWVTDETNTNNYFCFPTTSVLEIWESEYKMLKEYYPEETDKTDWNTLVEIVVNNAQKRDRKTKGKMEETELRKKREEDMKKDIMWTLKVVGKEADIRNLRINQLKELSIENIVIADSCSLSAEIYNPIKYQKLSFSTKASNLPVVLELIKQNRYNLSLIQNEFEFVKEK